MFLLLPLTTQSAQVLTSWNHLLAQQLKLKIWKPVPLTHQCLPHCRDVFQWKDVLNWRSLQQLMGLKKHGYHISLCWLLCTWCNTCQRLVTGLWTRLVQNGWTQLQRKATPIVGISFSAARRQHDQVARHFCYQGYFNTPSSTSHLYAYIQKRLNWKGTEHL